MKELTLVKWFCNQRGYGFLVRHDNEKGPDIFLHHREVVSSDEFKAVYENDIIECVVHGCAEKPLARDAVVIERGVPTVAVTSAPKGAADVLSKVWSEREQAEFLKHFAVRRG